MGKIDFNFRWEKYGKVTPIGGSWLRYHFSNYHFRLSYKNLNKDLLKNLILNDFTGEFSIVTSITFALKDEVNDNIIDQLDKNGYEYHGIDDLEYLKKQDLVSNIVSQHVYSKKGACYEDIENIQKEYFNGDLSTLIVMFQKSNDIIYIGSLIRLDNFGSGKKRIFKRKI